MRGRSTILFGFLAVITAGAIALASPWSRMAGTWGDWSDAAFTACSAVCVTGLSVVDIAKEYSFAISTTESPVTQTAEQAVNAASDQLPQVPAFRAQGEESAIAPMVISARNPRTIVERLLTRTCPSP